MKIISTTLFVLTVFLSWSQEVPYFEDEIHVSDGAVYGNVRPRIAISNGTPLILYGKSGGGLLYVSRWNGAGFDAPVNLLPSGMETYLAGWTGPDIAAKGDTVIVVFKAIPLEGGRVYSVRSTDGGLTFSDTIRVDSHDTGVAWMPSLDITDDGNPIVTYMAHDASWSNPRYVIANSSDAGLTYNPEMEVTGSIPGEACDCCPAEVAVSGQKQVMLFRNNESNLRDIHGVLSIDGGITFPYSDDLDETQWIINSCPSTGPSGTFVGDELFTAFASRASGDYRVYVSRSSSVSDLIYIEHDTVMESNITTSSQNYPRIHSSGDTIVLAWQENQGSNADIYVSVATGSSNPQLTNLSDYPMLSNQTTISAQINPDIRIEDGIIHLCYQDLSSGDVLYRRGAISGLGIKEHLKGATLTIAPNPSTDASFVIPNTDQLKNLTITDLQGREVDFTENKLVSGTYIQILQAVSGTYIIAGELINGDKVFSKLVVQL